MVCSRRLTGLVSTTVRNCIGRVIVVQCGGGVTGGSSSIVGLFWKIRALDVWVLMEVSLLVVVSHVCFISGSSISRNVIFVVVVLGSVCGRSHPGGSIERSNASSQTVTINTQSSKYSDGNSYQEERKERPSGSTGPVGAGVVKSLGEGRYNGHNEW